MSENIPLPSTSGASSLQHRKSKRKYDKTKLPTPPPDPAESKDEQPADPQKENDELMEYLEHLQRPHPGLSRSPSVFAPAIIAEGAFLHLEKLYKLMEQLLELREQNARLHRRVRDLEHVSNLEKMHKDLDVTALASAQLDCPYLDRDTALAESYLESILAESRKEANPKPKPSAPARLRHSILRRNRSGSGTERSLEVEGLSSRRTSSCVDDRNKSAKVSKWTKVKAAFKWEKASVADAKSQDSGLSGMMPMNTEMARYLRVPSTSEEGHSPADSGAAGISTPGTLSTASSTEDFPRNLRTPCDDFRSSEDEYGQSYIPHSKDEQSSSQKSSIKSHRTPWAKMKDIIHTRNSFKKKNRLSTHSDDIQIDIEFCSDNEDVFEDDGKTTQLPYTTGSSVNDNRQRTESDSDVPAEIVARYQQAVADDDMSEAGCDLRKNSKWSRVKKAFLTNDCPKECKSDDESKSVQAEINRNYRQLQKKLSLEFQEKLNEWERLKQHSPGTSNPSSVCGFSDETRDPAFIKKMEEWQRMKGQPSKNTIAAQMPAQENLPPEFKKRLEEWNKMKRCNEKQNITQKRKLGDVPRWKSISGPRTDSSTSFEYAALSDEFKKKLEEWKQIKASGLSPMSTEDGENRKPKDNKSPSPKLTRKNSSGKLKKFHKEGPEKELQWFEKELNRIEKEKQKLEAERRKFIEREERLSKLRNSVVGDKKEVRINTPSGSYRFEGISKKFAEKLYEWEKAQGIAPEASTFALLSSQFTAESRASSKNDSPGNTPPLMRSKSADSVAVSSTNLCPHLHTQPSSLSLNDVQDLDKKCSEGLEEASSLQYLGNSHESIDQDEPEALIVEVEDIIEETACPLRTYMDKQQQPIYQREEIKAICEGETLAAPKVRRSETARAQVNYSLIEQITTILSQLSVGECKIEKFDSENRADAIACQENQAKLQNLDESQATVLRELHQKLTQLQEANRSVITSARAASNRSSQVEEYLDQIQALSAEISHMSEKLHNALQGRSNGNDLPFTVSTQNLLEELQEKLPQLKKHLNYFCAAPEHTVSTFGPQRKEVAKKTLSSESRDSKTETDLSRGSSDKSSAAGRLYTKAASSTQSQGAIKKRIKYRQKNLQNRISPDTDEEEELNNEQKKKPRKLTKNRSISDNESLNEATQDENTEKKDRTGELQIDEALMKKVVIPTKTSYLNLQSADISQDSSSDTPVTVFVKTTRKLFTPLIESQIAQQIHKTNAPTPLVEEVRSADSRPTQDENDSKQNSSRAGNIPKVAAEEIAIGSCFVGLPPLPASPSSQRRQKEISPSIRMMMVKYNQKVNEKEAPTTKSGGSSGSASPVAWRSPTFERRVKVQREKYQEAVLKHSPKLQRDVKKSASASYLQDKQPYAAESSGADRNLSRTTVKPYDMTKSSSIGILTCAIEQTKYTGTIPKNVDKKHPDLKVIINKDNVPTYQSLEMRKRRLQKAKEEFFQSSPLTAPPNLESEAIQFPSRNRLSQISVESGSSLDSTCAGVLMKSASAGMINIQAEVFKQIDPELHGGGYVSLPRSPKQQKQGLLGGKFDFSSIASKFRRVRMRKGKDREQNKMNAVSALCRQSLVVDINRNDSENDSSNTESRRVSSEDPSPSTSRSGSWIKKPKFFKK